MSFSNVISSKTQSTKIGRAHNGGTDTIKNTSALYLESIQ